MKTILFSTVSLLAVSVAARATTVSIDGTQWQISGRITHPGAPAEGLLMNVRMVNSTFEDSKRTDFDSDGNTDRFIHKIPEYGSYGVRAFTLNLQGGLPGYEGAVNSAFSPDGTLRASYMKRIKRVIQECDNRGMIVILGLFYQRQDQILRDENAVRRAVVNAVNWVEANGFGNVVIEIANEYDHKGFDHDVIETVKGEIELIRLAKKTAPDLLVSTSGLGHGRMNDKIAEQADFILIHFNGTKVADIPKRIDALKKHNKPIVCNEDDKLGEEAARALQACVENGCSWGFMHKTLNQFAPFEFNGYDDDLEVYDKFKEVTGIASVSERTLRDGQSSVTITGSGLGDKKGSGRVELWTQGVFQNDRVSADQLVTGWSDKQVTFTVVLPQYKGRGWPGYYQLRVVTAGAKRSDVAQVLVGPQQEASAGQLDCGFVELPADCDPQSIISNESPGTAYLITGAHVGHTITSKDGDVYIFEAGASMRGSKVVENWVSDGGLWRSDGHAENSSGYTESRIEEGWEPSTNDIELFRNGVRVRRLAGRAAVAGYDSDAWFFDEPADKVYANFNPNSDGSLVTMSTAPSAFVGGANNVTLRGPAPDRRAEIYEYSGGAAIRPAGGAGGWFLQYLYIHHNHEHGWVFHGDNFTVADTRTSHNARSGFYVAHKSGQARPVDTRVPATGIAIVRMESDHNNTNHYATNWWAGGSKIQAVENVVADQLYIHHNYGKGWWSDGVHNDNHRVTRLRSEYNSGVGLFFEMGNFQHVSNSWLHDNSTGDGYSGEAKRAQVRTNEAGMHKANGPDKGVEIINNVIEVQASGGKAPGPAGWSSSTGRRGPGARNVVVTGNRVVYLGVHDGGWHPRSGFMAGDSITQERVAMLLDTSTVNKNAYHAQQAGGQHTFFVWPAAPGWKNSKVANFDQWRSLPFAPDADSTFTQHTRASDLPVIDRARVSVDAQGIPTWDNILTEPTTKPAHGPAN